jgi:uncharacterized SAM-binding protein YcdF (DUF218 family)
MFGFLKILLHFFQPLSWIIIVFIYALLTKPERRKQLAYRWAFGMLIFFTNPFIIRTLMKAYETKAVQLAPTQKFNTGILLGGLVSYNKYEDAGYFNNASDRFIETALLYKQGHIENIIVAAGHGYPTKNNFTEAGFIRGKLIQLGVPQERIFIEGASRNTLENAQFSKRLADSVHVGGPYLLISSAMHLPRASKVFRKAGIDAVLYPCEFQTKGYGDNFLIDYILPSSLAFNRWENLIKEWIGSVVYSVTGNS